MTEIKLLKDFPQHSSVLAYWCYMEWYWPKSKIPYEAVVRSFKERLNDKKFPVSWIAFENGIPAGMVSFKEKDLWSRDDLSPWLVSLYVAHTFRNNGIAEKLIKAVLDKAVEFGYKTLYLFVSGNNAYLTAYYLKRGWQKLCSAPGNQGGKVEILYFQL